MRRIPHLLVTAITGAALALAAGCTGSGEPAGLERVSYLTGAGVQGRESYIYVAMARGFFREAGLEVEVRPGNGTLQNLQVLQSGQADFAVVDITAALIEYGRSGSTFRNFTVVSAIQQRNLACVMALEGSGITRAADLAGKRIAYIPGGVVKTLFEPYARLAGVDGATISWVSMPVPQMGPNLASGSIDAATQFVVGKPAIEAVAGGRKAVVLPFSDHLTDLYGNGLAVTRKAAADDPERVRRFNDAMLRGLRYAIEHPAEAGKIYARYQKLQPEAVAAAETTLMGPYVTDGAVPIGALSPERVTRNIAAIRGAGVIPAEFAPGDAVTFDFAPKG